MSLKAFHLVFIIFSLLLSVGLGFWGVRDYMQTQNGTNLLIGIISFAVGAGLVIYAPWFLKKLKAESYL